MGNLSATLLCKSERAKESRRAFIRLSEGGRRRQREGVGGDHAAPRKRRRYLILLYGQRLMEFVI